MQAFLREFDLFLRDNTRGNQNDDLQKGLFEKVQKQEANHTKTVGFHF